MTNDILQKEKERDEEISSAKNVIHHVFNMESDVVLRHRKRILSLMIFLITEADGFTAEKRTGYKKKITYNSESVKEIRGSGNENVKDLIHEHVYKRKILVQELLANPKDIELILKKAIACVVTKDEHDRLHKIDKEFDGWDRYKKAKIRVWNTRTNNWEIDTCNFLLSDNKKENGI